MNLNKLFLRWTIVFGFLMTLTVSGWGANADLGITKSVSDTTPSVGDTVRFTIVGTNNGPTTTAMIITDTLPAGLTYVSNTDNRSSYSCSNSGGTVTCSGTRTYATGNNVTITIDAIVESAGSITNTASIAPVTAGVTDTVTTSNNSASVTLTATALNADLAITKSVNNTTPSVGDTVTFTIVGTNNGPTATAMTITDTLPAGLTYVSNTDNRSSYSCSNSGGTVTCSGSRLYATGNNVTVTIDAIVESAGSITNTASIAPATTGVTDTVTTTNNTASVTLTAVTPNADLGITKSVNDTTPNMGDTVTFTIVGTNNGPSATAMTITDTLPAGLTFVSVADNQSNYSCSNSGGTVTCSGSRLYATGNNVTVAIQATVASAGSITNTASIAPATAGVTDTVTTSNNSASVTLTATALNADLAITKTVNYATPAVGETVTFTIVGTNNGPTTTAMTITDSLPAGLTYVSNTVNRTNYSCTNSGGTVTCSGTRTYATANNVTVTIQATVAAAGSITNTATITPATVGVTDSVTTGNNTASVTLTGRPLHAVNDSFTTPYNTVLNGNVLTNDYGTSISVISNTLPSQGTLSLAANGAFTYTPGSYYSGADSFTYTIQDSNGDTDTATVTITVNAIDYSVENLREFKLYRQDNIYGDMKIIGNSVKLDSNNGGTCAPNGTNNNSIVAVYADKDSDSSTFNSTSADLVLPKGVDSSKVLYALLYWQGRTNSNSNVPNGRTVKLKTFNESSYTTISSILSKFNWTGGDYQGVADVTTQIKNSIDAVPASTITSTGYNKPVWAADIYAPASSDAKNDFGAWSLVIVYKNPDAAAKFRSISLFDGYIHVTRDLDGNATLDGFLTPKSGLVDAKFLFFGGEGDISYTGDEIFMNNSGGTPVSLGGNIFRSTEDEDGVNILNRNPSCQNTIGVDIRTFKVGDANGGLGIIGNNQTSTKIQLTSTQDEYFPGVFAFSTELYMPKLCYDYSYKQDNRYLKADNNGSLGNLPYLYGTISDSPIETSVYIRNKEADISVNAVSFFTDVNTTLFNYIPGSTGTTNVNGTAYDIKADTGGSCDYSSTSTSSVACNDGHNVRIGLGNGAIGYGQTTSGYLGSQEFVYAKFDLSPNITGLQDVNQSLGLQLNYYIQPDLNAAPIVYSYTLGKDIDLCPPSTGYQPTWGIFNVVDAAASTVGVLPANNLRTQVSRNPFNVDVAVYQKNTTTGKYTDKPTSDLNTTVLVEIIDNDAYHDANASCGNPGSAVSKPIFVRIGNTATDMTIPVPTQNTMYHNFAVQNAAFRIWYFDQNQTLIDWSATTSDPLTHLSLSSISNLYKNSYHNEKCASSCGTSTSTACFDCIKANYAKPLCSRDNFSVRPESFDLRIFDINQTADAVIQDATKIDLSDKYQYAPMYGASMGRINVAAGYDYRYDLNATGHDSNLSAVPGYTQNFKGFNTDYNATMIWEPTSTKTGCNDTSSKSLSFYVANGQMVNAEQNQSQVGEYRLNIIDPSWTAVDWKSTLTGHHTNANGFEVTKEDCIVGSDSTSSVGGKIGCVTTSAHAGGGYTYKDHLLTLQPYKFTIPSTFRYGTVPYDLNTTWSYDGNLTNDVLTQANIIYYSKLSNNSDLNMSLQIDGSIAAVGYNGTGLSNFVSDCYSKPINLTLDHNRTAQTRTNYQSRFLDYNSTGTLIYDSGAVNVPVIGAAIIHTVSDGNFSKDMHGALDSKVRVNFDRNASVVINPMPVSFYNYGVNCPDCNRSADLNASSAYGAVGMGFDVMHYYGRAQGRDATYVANSANQAGGYARIYFEMYCSNADTNASSGGVDCDMGRLSSNLAGENPGWYVNIDHNITNDGRSDSDNILSIGNLKVGTAVVPPAGSVTITPTEIGFERYGVNYNGNNGYPLSKILENYANGWLIYNTSNPGILYNSFSVEFRKKGAWIGEGKSGTATDSDAPIQTNRRIMW